MQWFRLIDVDPDQATGVLVSGYSGEEIGVVINLLTGELSRLPESTEQSKSLIEIIRYTLTSPTGAAVLEYSGESSTVTIRDAEGNKLGLLSEKRLPGLSRITWSPDGARFSFITRGKGAGSREAGLWLFSLDERRYWRVVAGDIWKAFWSNDGRYLACIKSGEQPENLPSRRRRSHGAVLVFDAEDGFKQVSSVGSLAQSVHFSPSGDRFAFTDLEKDEYGEFKIHTVRVAETVTGQSSEIVSARREPSYVWTSEGLLMLVVYDERAVPTLQIVDPGDGRTKSIVREARLAWMEPLAYLPARQMAVYKGNSSISRTKIEELWAVEAGKAPVRLYPKTKDGNETDGRPS